VFPLTFDHSSNVNINKLEASQNIYQALKWNTPVGHQKPSIQHYTVALHTHIQGVRPVICKGVVANNRVENLECPGVTAQ
jgi:hypothetical protein